MKQIIAILALITLIGWATSSATISGVPASDPPRDVLRHDVLPHDVLVDDKDGGITIGGYSVTTDDLADVVKLWRVNSAMVMGEGSIKFSDAEKVMAALQSVGVPEVTIADVPTNAQTQGPPQAPDYRTHPLPVYVDRGGRASVAGYSVTDDDFPNMRKLWNVRSAVITGERGTKFKDAEKVKSALEAAGVPDVKIADQTRFSQGQSYSLQ
jgi:biopolymer transport protein ExbD